MSRVERKSLQTHRFNWHFLSLQHINWHFGRQTDWQRSFSCAAPATWNSLPPAVINVTLSVFKSRLKSHLFNTDYS